tara:strand:- start:689444 stop:690097 length:654 start_codon:yes stop_codon:yes gene_type:complete
LAIAIGSVVAATGTSNAGVINTYADRLSFEADISGIVTESFDSFASDATFHETSLDVGDFSLLSSGNTMDPVRRNKIDVPPLEFGLFSLNGSTIANVSLNPGGTLLVTFEDAIMAFGADFAHLNNDMVRAEIVVNGETLNPGVAAADTPRFYGFTSDTPFTMVTFRGIVGTSGDGFGIDDVSYSEDCVTHNATVPEPGTLLGFAAFALLAGGSRRRR